MIRTTGTRSGVVSCEQPRGCAGYAEHAEEIFDQYESVAFENVHKSILDLYPKAPSQILDIGSGSGRYAAALAKHGHYVTAVEPTKALLTRAQSAHGLVRITWIKDHLPALERVRGKEHSFALIILSAVWMHLDRDEQYASMRRLGELLASAGLVSISLRHGPVPRGRVMFDVKPEDVCAQASENGLTCVRLARYPDPLDRADVYWTIIALSGSCRTKIA